MGRLIPDAITPATPAEMYAALHGCDPSLSRNSLLLLVGQFGLETGWGHAMHCHNVANIKLGGVDHDYCQYRCSEIVGGKEIFYDPPNPATSFRAYGDLAGPDGGAQDYMNRLRGEFRYAWPAVLAGDPVDFAHRLKVARFYTADESKYTAAELSIVHALMRQIPEDAPLPIPAPDSCAVSALVEAIGLFDPGQPTPPGDLPEPPS